MARIAFETLEFREKGDNIEITFLKFFSFELPKDAINRIGNFKADGSSIEFKGVDEKNARNSFNMLLSKGFSRLRNKITGKPAVYVHRNSGIPLIGNIAFGIVDRNTSIIEAKPITVCNLKCIYCSVNDDLRPVDFVVEKDYMAEEMKKLVEYKGCEGIEIHIGGQAEPLYYADLVQLVKDFSSIKGVREISIDTNCTLLTKAKVDALVEAGMTRFNLSINAMDQEIAEKIAGAPYSLKNALETARYISKKADLIIAPVWMKGINDDEIPKIIEFAKELKKASNHKVIVGIQNFLNYRQGRNPARQMPWDEFMKRLEELEKKHGINLILDFKNDFSVKPTKPLPKPFKKGQRADAEIVCNGRLAGEKIAVANGRSISLQNCSKAGKVRVKITGAKHNIYYGFCE